MRSFAVLLLGLSFGNSGWSAEYALILNEPATTRTARVRFLPAHESIKAELRSRNFQITGEASILLNAVFVSASPSDLQQLRSIPGVQYVARLPRFRRKLDRAEQLINVPAAWNLLGGIGNAGAGVKIGIIDTGIESTHPAFQDPSLTTPANYPVCAIAEYPAYPLDCARFTNNKIIVARSYVAKVAGFVAGTPSIAAADSRPDDYSPRDRVGHGTAVAMAAAGVTNTGPSDTITGVAPKAFLGSYKVFGSPGVGDFTTGSAVIAALEDAFMDGMDIAVLSLGAPALSGPLDVGRTCGLAGNQECDPEVIAVQNAVNSGMVVVVAAGNEGAIGAVAQPTLTTVNSPAVAPNAIAVAAITNSHVWSNTLVVNGLNTYRSQLGNGPLPPAALAGPLADAGSAGDPQACTALPAGSLNGAIALVARGPVTCTFALKVQNLQAAGAIGAIITNYPGDNSLLSPGGLSGTTTIPATFIGYDDGQAIRSYLQTTPAATATLNPNRQPFEAAVSGQVAAFSSRGPVLSTGALKPDITAVGTDVYLAGQTYDPNGDLYSASGYLVSQGTSFSTPQIAGIAALVKQAHPTMTALQIKSAIVNTATQDVTDAGAPASVIAMGAGKANAAFAVAADLVANPTAASFGILRAGFSSLFQEIQLINTGINPLVLTIAINRRTADNAAVTSIDRPNLTIASGQFDTFRLTLSGSLPSPGIYEGFVTVQGGASVLQIPYLYVVGQGIPYNIVSLIGDGDDGTVGQVTAEGGIVLQVTDRFGVAAPNLPVQFTVLQGGGALRNKDLATDVYGLASAATVLGPNPGINEYAATAGALTTTFTSLARAQPSILPNGAVNAASYQAGLAVAPGSWIAIFGNNLAGATRTETTPYMPLALNQVTVSFDAAGISAPGHIEFVTPGQVNVQVPWELQGQPSARMKVSVADSSGSLYTLPLTFYSPAMFEYTSGSASYVAARDENFNVIGPSTPAKQGSIIQLYCNGMGPVTNQPLSGDPALADPLSMTLTTPVVMIGGQRAAVGFSGLAPTAVGLYQINVTVPNTGPGMKPVTISIGGITGQASSIVVQ